MEKEESFVFTMKKKDREPDWFLREIGGQVQMKQEGFSMSLVVNGVNLNKGDTVILNDGILSIEQKESGRL